MGLPQIEFYFTMFDFEGDPDTITRELGIEPSSISRKGIRRWPHLPPARQNVWTIKSDTPSDVSDLQEHWIQLSALLKPRRPIITKLNAGGGKKFTIWLTCVDGQTGIRLEKDIIDFSSEINAEIEIELIVNE
ncbi:DUF4279 domain-containing protein [Methylobacterium indicum]|uniref:DUF4279 domain-containing protein n=1 Tax=Methylobacterium indicum TaxID=1775910 RepID=UPI0024357537|nr:DUF4279 domain-containing protein [Methylobacterium indicum]